MAGLAGVILSTQCPGQTLAQEIDLRIESVATAAASIGEGEADMALLEVLPQARIDLADALSLEAGLRLEAAQGEVSLGTRQTYSDLSRPIRLSDEVGLEVDSLVLNWRQGSTRLRLGKQSFAWGVLDGLQVTDRLDPSRRRQAVFIDQRPDRISRWGARAEFEALGIRWDAVSIFDGTADRLAPPEDAFALTAPRFRGGLPTGAPLPTIIADVSSNHTYGLRARTAIGASDLTLLAFSGPETEPVFILDPASVTLTYPNRTLYGANFQFGSGSQVWRAEIAYVPSQPVNIGDAMLSIEERERILGGIGLDWTLGNNIFLNAQIGVDWIGGGQLLRPNTDVISTIRMQKPWSQDTFLTKAELITSLTDGDGTFRPSVSWQVSDTLAVDIGVDLIWGARDELIGQFADRDRMWVRLRFTG